MDSVKMREPVKPGKRELTRLRNRQAILSAARECFAQKGYEQVTVRDIISKTNLASGTFYNYFTDKESIFRAILDDYLKGLDQKLIALQETAKTLDERIYAAYLALFLAIADDPLLYELAHDNHRAIRDLYDSNLLGQAFQSLEQEIVAAMAEGRIPEANVKYITASFFGVAYEMGLAVARQVPDEPEEAARVAAALFLGGLKEVAKLTN